MHNNWLSADAVARRNTAFYGRMRDYPFPLSQTRQDSLPRGQSQPNHARQLFPSDQIEGWSRNQFEIGETNKVNTHVIQLRQNSFDSLRNKLDEINNQTVKSLALFPGDVLQNGGYFRILEPGRYHGFMCREDLVDQGFWSLNRAPIHVIMNDSRNIEIMVPSPFFYRPPTPFETLDRNTGEWSVVNLVSEGLKAQRDFILEKRFPNQIEE